MKKPAVSLVLGGGHSIGVPLAVSSKRSFIVPSTSMTIHPVRINGPVLGVPESFSSAHKIRERIISFITSRASISAQRICDLMMNKYELVMDVGTVLDGKRAVLEGLIDELGGLSSALFCLNNMIKQGKQEEDMTQEKTQR
jgi:ATP-dependent protease ClpP protease subunit